MDGSDMRFVYSFALSAAAASAKECRNYDDDGGREDLDTEADPVPTPGRSCEWAGARAGDTQIPSPKRGEQIERQKAAASKDLA